MVNSKKDMNGILKLVNPDYRSVRDLRAYFIAAIDTARRENKMSMQRLARESSLEYPQLLAIYSGETPITPVEMSRLSFTLDLTMDEIIPFNEKLPTPKLKKIVQDYKLFHIPKDCQTRGFYSAAAMIRIADCLQEAS